MSYQDRAMLTPSTPGRDGRAAVGRARTFVARMPRFNRGIVVWVLLPGLALLAAGCVRFTHHETPTSAPDVASSPVLTLTAGGATPPSEPEGETPMPTPTVSGPAVLRMQPAVADLAVGEKRAVQVWLDNVERLHSIELRIGFEPRYVRIEDADPDTAGVQVSAGVIPMPVQVIQNEADNDVGWIIYQVAGAPGNPARGSGMVAAFTARALAEGGTPLKFSVANLRDPEGLLLAAPQQVDGLVVISAGGPVSEPTAVPSAPATATPAPSADVHHTVQPGENLFRIALRYGTTVDAIVAANNLPDSGAVRAGQVLLIPIGSPATTATYVVQAGDTLYSIARRFDTTVETLAALNGLIPPYTIEVGQVLIVTP
jgi:LysM repeat protein